MRAWLVNVHVSVRLARRQARHDMNYTISGYLVEVLEDLDNEFTLSKEEVSEIKRVLAMHNSLAD